MAAEAVHPAAVDRSPAAERKLAVAHVAALEVLLAEAHTQAVAVMPVTHPQEEVRCVLLLRPLLVVVQIAAQPEARLHRGGSQTNRVRIRL